ncbi:MAG: hypothetical protein P1U63_07365 [Coxiellaceae bacterium]|nr:hypothetical protein [Coxiellaceae bacterium]
MGRQTTKQRRKQQRAKAKIQARSLTKDISGLFSMGRLTTKPVAGETDMSNLLANAGAVLAGAATQLYNIMAIDYSKPNVLSEQLFTPLTLTTAAITLLALGHMIKAHDTDCVEDAETRTMSRASLPLG